MPKTTRANFKDIARIHRMLGTQQVELELEINATPTGGARELLTEANIHLLEAIGKLRELLT